uniref:GLPGLI family protein n=1 Tax=Flavobacterium sp. TaxID=239 RepID=UPI00404ACD98
KRDSENLTITAWFCPKIPVPYGPNGYGELPGLILELKTYVSTIIVKTINLNVTPEPKIEKLEEYPQLTRNEIYNLFMSGLSQEKKKIILESKTKK